MSVTPQDPTPARNASLLVRASGRGCVEESRMRRWPRVWLTARPSVPLLDDRTVSILSLLMVWLLLAAQAPQISAMTRATRRLARSTGAPVRPWSSLLGLTGAPVLLA